MLWSCEIPRIIHSLFSACMRIRGTEVDQEEIVELPPPAITKMASGESWLVKRASPRGSYVGRVDPQSFNLPPEPNLKIEKKLDIKLNGVAREMFPSTQPETTDARQLFHDLVLDLTRGSYFTQLNSRLEFEVIFCSVDDQLEILTLDENDGRKIEFPLIDVQSVYIIHQELARYGQFERGLHALVVVEFSRRKLAFVFEDLLEGERFDFGFRTLIQHVKRRRNSYTSSWANSCCSAALRCLESQEAAQRRPTLFSLPPPMHTAELPSDFSCTSSEWIMSSVAASDG